MRWDILLLVISLIFALYLLWAVNESGRRERAELREAKENVVKTKYLESQYTLTERTVPDAGKILARAAVGDYLFGPIGAAIGAASAKDKVKRHREDTTTFLVYYKDGSEHLRTVHDDTKLYKFYMEKLGR